MHVSRWPGLPVLWVGVVCWTLFALGCDGVVSSERRSSPDFAATPAAATSERNDAPVALEDDAADRETNGVAEVVEEPIPPAPTHYKGRLIAQTMHWMGAEWLTRETRDSEEHTSAVVEALQLEPGMTVCDLGCGNGYYTLKLARGVSPGGTVLAVEIQREYFGMLEQRAAEAGIDNIELVLGSVINPNLPKASCDVILLVDVYHEFSHPEHMLRRIRESLKPEGVMVLLEFRAEDPNVPIKPEHKMTKAQIMKEIPPNGFKLVGEVNTLPWQHMMFFARDDAEMEEVEPASEHLDG